jgi:hypothetical protein
VSIRAAYRTQNPTHTKFVSVIGLINPFIAIFAFSGVEKANFQRFSSQNGKVLGIVGEYWE